jgi:hypothetical protein
MRLASRALLGLSFALAGCGGPKAIALPADPVDRAATCGIVAAAAVRTSIDVNAPLPLETHGRVLHYAMLAASDDGTFKAGVASRVSKRMAQLQESVTGADWKALAAPCDAAYPVAAKKGATLPDGRLDAQLACQGLADFVSLALEGEAKHYGNELAAYRLMRRELNEALGAGLRARAGSNLQAQKRVREKAIAEATQLGSPIPVLERCRERFK